MRADSDGVSVSTHGAADFLQHVPNAPGWSTDADRFWECDQNPEQIEKARPMPGRHRALTSLYL